MITIENRCIGCELQDSCSIENCNYGNVNVYYCDMCDGYAKYRIDEKDMCEECANKYCDEIWSGFTVEEKCEMLSLFFDRRY